MMALEISRRSFSSLLLASLILIAIQLAWVSGFQSKSSPARALVLKPSTTSLGLSEDQISDFERPGTFLDEDEDDDAGINVVYIDEDDELDDGEEDDDDEPVKGAGRSRWENLKPAVKKRLIEKGQAKAITNKKKREPAAEKKRRESQIWFHLS